MRTRILYGFNWSRKNLSRGGLVEWDRISIDGRRVLDLTEQGTST